MMVLSEKGLGPTLLGQLILTSDTCVLHESTEAPCLHVQYKYLYTEKV